MVLDRSPHQESPGNQDWMAWSGILLCVAMASRLSPGSAWLALPLNLAFWTLLVVWVRSSGAAAGVVALGWLLPVYYLTFRFSRGLVETMDVVLDTDGARYLEEAAELAFTPRHVGFPVVTFPRSVLDGVGGELAGLDRLGVEYLYLQTAAIGMLAAVLFHALLERSGLQSRLHRLLVTTLFALGLATWVLSSTVETYMFSVFLMLVFVVRLQGFSRSPSVSGAAELALITVAALTISLENGYLAIVLTAAVPWILRGRERRKVLRAAAAYAGLVVLVFAVVVAVATHGRAADFYSTWGDENFASAATGLPTHLQHFASNYVRFDEGLSPKGILVTGFRVFVMSIRAQAGIPIETYTWEPTRDLLLRPANVAYLAILSTLLLMAARGWRSIVRQRDEQRLFLGFVLGVVVVLRQAAVTLLAPRESLLFAPPTHAALWLFVGIGLAGLPTRGRFRVASATLLAALAIVVIASNLAWLIAAGS